MVAAHEDASWRFSWFIAAQAAGLHLENRCKSRDPINQTTRSDDVISPACHGSQWSKQK
jgi:hypothetical protein